MEALYGIDPVTLRRLVIEALKEKPETQVVTLLLDVERLAVKHAAFPTPEQCTERGVSYDSYARGKLNRFDELNVVHIAWDLIAERVLTPSPSSNYDRAWPFMRLTAFGQAIVAQASPSYLDPDGYLLALRAVVPKLDPVIEQYVSEALRAFRQCLYFASAVMLGAASEKAVLLLLESIGDAETDAGKKQAIADLLEHGRLPAIFATVQSTVEKLVKAGTLPYKVHEGSLPHLLSLFEMIRVQRNDAVHPAAGQVSKEKVFLAIQGLPAALAAAYKLSDWFKGNRI